MKKPFAAKDFEMRIQWKITLVVFVVVLAVVTAMTWRTQSLYFQDKMDFVADSSMKQISPLKRLVQQKLEESKTNLVNFAAGRVALGEGKVESFGDFDVVALVQPSESGQWTPAWVEKGPSADSGKWPLGHDLTLIKSLPFKKVRDGEAIWVRLSDHQGSPVYAFMISVEIQNAQTAKAVSSRIVSQLPEESLSGKSSSDASALASGKAVIVGFSSIGPLAAVAEDYIGSTSKVFLVDDRGYVASHVNKSYMGASFGDDDIVREITKKKMNVSFGRYRDLDGQEIFGHYEKIDRTNLFAVITTPVATYVSSVRSSALSSAIIGLSIGLLGVLGSFFFGNRLSRSLQKAIDLVKSANSGEPLLEVAPSKSRDEVGVLSRMLAESSPAALASKAGFISGDSLKSDRADLDSHGTATKIALKSRASSEPSASDTMAQTRRAALEVFNEGLANALRDPLLAILGHAQLIRSKAEEMGSRVHTDGIEREARSAKDLLDKLSQWSTNAPSADENEVVDLESAVVSVIAKNKDLLDSEEIMVELDLRNVPKARGSSIQMQSVLNHLIENAREAMRARIDKKLKIQLDYLNDQVFVVVSDTGVGMSRDVKERAFDPFFKSFETPNHQGLGLAFVRAALRQIGGVCDIDSTPGEGATFTIKIPVPAAEKAAFMSRESAPAEKRDVAVTAAATVAPTVETSPEKQTEKPTKFIDSKAFQDLLSDDDDETFDALLEGRLQISTDTPQNSSPVLSDLDSDDDESEVFANIALGRAAEVEASAAPGPSLTSGSGSEDQGFQVKIRKPKRGN